MRPLRASSMMSSIGDYDLDEAHASILSRTHGAQHSGRKHVDLEIDAVAGLRRAEGRHAPGCAE